MGNPRVKWMLVEITLPVCLTAYTGAAIAGANWLRVAFTAIKLALVTFIIPFAFVNTPALLLRAPAAEVIWAVSTAVLGTISLGVGVIGYVHTSVNLFSRMLFIAGGVALLFFGWETDLLGAGLILLGLLTFLGQRFLVRGKSEVLLKAADRRSTDRE